MAGMPDHSCIFCNIVAGKIPCSRVYETDELLAFLDINPMNKGHVLVIPKQHMETLFDVPTSLGTPLLEAMKVIGKAIMEATNATGLNVFQNNFASAWQQVPHAHWHLVPRFDGDGYGPWTPKKYTDTNEMQSLAQAIEYRITHSNNC